MTLVTEKLAVYTPALSLGNGEAFVGATWDDTMEQEDGTLLDPNATMLIESVWYKNTTTRDMHLDIGGVTYLIPSGTPETTRNLNPPQRTRIDSVSYFSFY